jgi:hypothetical protein
MPDINNPLDDDKMKDITEKGKDMAREHLQGGGSDEDREQQEQEQPPQENIQERAEGEARERLPGDVPF